MNGRLEFQNHNHLTYHTCGIRLMCLKFGNPF